MMYATVAGRLATAQPRLYGQCPGCHGDVLAKCGTIITPHWAHVATDDCDPWSEPESAWHQGWKLSLQTLGARIEVTVGNHRADAITPCGVLELQHSPIDTTQAREREDFYGRMAWLYDMRDDDRWQRVHFGARGFWWKHGSRTQAALRRPLFWHVPDGRVLRVQLNTVRTDADTTRVLGRVLKQYGEAEFAHAIARTRENGDGGSADAVLNHHALIVQEAS